MVQNAAFLYLLIPALIFVAGWLNIPAMVVITTGLLCSFFTFLKEQSTPKNGMLISSTDKTKRILTVVIIIVWVFFAGIGGFIWQNLWDHKFRNAIFMDLVNYSWPVVNGENALCYYIGFWMPAALVGKLAGLEAGYFFQAVWAIIGMVLVMKLLFQYMGRIRLRYVFFFIFFSGLDVAMLMLQEAYLWGVNPFNMLPEYIYRLLMGEHLELACNIKDSFFNSSSNTTLLFWLYNQAIPFWVGFLLILQQNNQKTVIPTYALLFLFSPFPCIGLIPYITYKVCSGGNTCLSLKEWLRQLCKRIFTIGNVGVLPFVAMVALYYKSNAAVGSIGLIPLELPTFLMLIMHFALEYGVYLLFIKPENRKDKTLWILAGTVLVCSFIQLGHSFDFAWRTCIPLTFYVMLLLMKAVDGIQLRSAKGVALALVFCIGMVTPATEMLRTVRHERYVIMGQIPSRSDSLNSVFTKENNECYDNFIADTDALFFRYLAANP